MKFNQTPVQEQIVRDNRMTTAWVTWFQQVYNIISGQNDIEITAIGKGVIMRSPNGNRWRLTVSNTGTTVWTPL